jgi:hypothetical protein
MKGHGFPGGPFSFGCSDWQPQGLKPPQKRERIAALKALRHPKSSFSEKVGLPEGPVLWEVPRPAKKSAGSRDDLHMAGAHERGLSG